MKVSVGESPHAWQHDSMTAWQTASYAQRTHMLNMIFVPYQALNSKVRNKISGKARSLPEGAVMGSCRLSQFCRRGKEKPYSPDDSAEEADSARQETLSLDEVATTSSLSKGVGGRKGLLFMHGLSACRMGPVA